MTLLDLEAGAAEVFKKQSTVPLLSPPSSWNPRDPELFPFPLERSWGWKTLGEILERHAPSLALYIAPPLWQIEPLFYDECRARGIPIYAAMPNNIPLAQKVAEELQAELVVGAPDPIRHIFEGLGDARQTIAVTIESAEALGADAFPIRRYREIHILPGVPVLNQCIELSLSKESLFHEVRGFSLQKRDAGFFVTAETSPIPLTDIPLPVSIKGAGRCVCGKETLLVERS